eukprot:9021177-Pyramimonas_sp.AAC.1
MFLCKEKRTITIRTGNRFGKTGEQKKDHRTLNSYPSAALRMTVRRAAAFRGKRTFCCFTQDVFLEARVREPLKVAQAAMVSVKVDVDSTQNLIYAWMTFAIIFCGITILSHCHHCGRRSSRGKHYPSGGFTEIGKELLKGVCPTTRNRYAKLGIFCVCVCL